MRKTSLMVVAIMMAAISLHAQDDAVQPYFQLEELPKLINILPPPPAFESPEFASDVVRYCWGKEQRQDPDRVAQAIADAEWNDHTKIYALWQEAFGLEISEANTPEIWTLLETSMATTDPMRKETKQFYKRQRPFERYEDSMPSHEEEELAGEGSYPSGHSLRGWGISLLLAQIAPQRADQIFKRGWDYCNSRVIVGAHWQSDVDNSRTAASIGFCALQGSEEFIQQMKKAQSEYIEKTQGQSSVSASSIDKTSKSSQAYNLQGQPVNNQYHGIVIEKGKKSIKY